MARYQHWSLRDGRPPQTSEIEESTLKINRKNIFEPSEPPIYWNPLINLPDLLIFERTDVGELWIQWKEEE